MKFTQLYYRQICPLYIRLHLLLAYLFYQHSAMNNQNKKNQSQKPIIKSYKQAQGEVDPPLNFAHGTIHVYCELPWCYLSSTNVRVTF